MIYQGTVRDGVVLLPPDVRLPDGLVVSIEPVERETPPARSSFDASSLRNGVPVFPRREGAPAPGLDLVNQLRDETVSFAQASSVWNCRMKPCSSIP